MSAHALECLSSSQLTRDQLFRCDFPLAPDRRPRTTSIMRGVSLKTPAADPWPAPSRVRYSRTFSASAMLGEEMSWTSFRLELDELCLLQGIVFQMAASSNARPKGISVERRELSRSSGWQKTPPRSHSRAPGSPPHRAFATGNGSRQDADLLSHTIDLFSADPP